MDYLEIMEFEQDECITLIHLKFRIMFAKVLFSIITLVGFGGIFYILFLFGLGLGLILPGLMLSLGVVFLSFNHYVNGRRSHLILSPHGIRCEIIGILETIPWKEILTAKKSQNYENSLTFTAEFYFQDETGEERKGTKKFTMAYEWGRECIGNGRIVPLELMLEWIEELRCAESDDERRSLIQEWKKPHEEETPQPKIKRKSRIKKRKRPRFLNPEIRKGRLRTLFKKRKRIPKKEEHETIASTVPLEDHAPSRKAKKPKGSMGCILLPIFLMLWMVCTATIGIALRSYFEMGWVILICFFIALASSWIFFYFWTKDPDWQDDLDEFS